MTTVFVEGAAIRAPGLNGWAASRSVLAGIDAYAAAPPDLPAIPLPPAERRRTVQTVKLALALGIEVFAATGRALADTATVFSSSGGDGETIHQILAALASDARDVSPTRFHNSVHNAPAGYWSIATRSHAPSTSIGCYDASFAAGLLEAAVQAAVEDSAVALIAYDVSYPEPLHSVRPLASLFGAALVLVPRQTPQAMARLDIALRPRAGELSSMALLALESLRRTAPSARALPLLAALARGAAETVTLEYISDLMLEVAVAPVAMTSPRLPRRQDVAADA
ncbi:MAG TPA: beta-ketoacyl synthase chain length factor [Stellaceae bacterium]|nr:beta-ketoacyl synthase chain length factor [Stellaceae bacterium]